MIALFEDESARQQPAGEALAASLGKTAAGPVPGYLPLSDYDCDFGRRLALSPKTDVQVKRIARLLLEMHRLPDLHSVSMRTGAPGRLLAKIRRTYLISGLRDVLQMHHELPAPKNVRVRLTVDERAFCRRVVDSCQGSRGRIRRARALLLLDEGVSKPSVARDTNVAVRTLNRLIERFQTLGAIDSVNEGERSGRPVVYSKAEFIPLIRTVVRQHHGTMSMRWSLDDFRQALASLRPEAAAMSRPTLKSLLLEAGVSYGFAIQGVS